jgi:6-phosphogluconolactonase
VQHSRPPETLGVPRGDCRMDGRLERPAKNGPVAGCFPMGKPTWIICRDSEELASKAVDLIRLSAAASIAARGRFTMVLAGGSTPRETYSLLGSPSTAPVDWSRTYLFFGDERFVPPNDERSNYRAVHDTLLADAAIAPDHVFAIPTLLPSAAQCAARYAETLGRFFGTDAAHPPVFDLVLLGLGDDGHVASLFPDAPSLSVTAVPVTASPSGTLPPHVDRITLTFGAINAARAVLFLVAGGNKAEAVREVYEGRVARERRPAAGVRPQAGTVTWLVDAAAAKLIATKLPAGPVKE